MYILFHFGCSIFLGLVEFGRDLFGCLSRRLFAREKGVVGEAQFGLGI